MHIKLLQLIFIHKYKENILVFGNLRPKNIILAKFKFC